MKVLEINVDDVGCGGVYAMVSNVIRHRPRELKLDIACIAEFESRDNVRALNAMGTEIFFVGTKGGKLSRPAAYYKNTLRLLRERQYDCVHIHGDVAYLMLIFAAAARRAGVRRIILHSHAAGIDGGSRRLKAALHGLAKGPLRRYATDFAACSDRAAEWMFKGVAPSKVRMVKNGVEVERFAFDPEVRGRVRRELGLEDALVIGHVGRFAYQKNHGFLLEAFAAIHGRLPRARLLMVGEGVLLDEARERAKALGISDCVRFHGASRDVAALMQAMDVFALPSHFEGLPVVGVEAQAAGLPVLFSDRVTRQAGLTDRVWFLPIEADSAGQWADRVQTLTDESADRRAGSDAVRRAGFTIQETVREFLELYGAEAKAGEGET